MARGKDFDPAKRQAFQELMIRLRAGRPQSEVADEAGVSQTTVSVLEKAPHPGINLVDLMALLNYYGVSPNEAFQVLGLYQPANHDDYESDPDVVELRSSLKRLLRIERKLVLVALRGMISGFQKENPPTNEGQGGENSHKRG